VALAAVLSMGGGIKAVSIVVATVATFSGPIVFYVAIRSFGGRWADVAAVITRPLVCGILSVGIAWLIAQGIETSGQGRLPYLFQLSVICGVTAVLNCLFAWLLMRPVWNDLWLRVRRMLPQRAAA
jgi:hypothetical protein